MILEIEKLKIDLDSTTGEEWMLLWQERSKRSSGLGYAHFLATDDIDYPLHFILWTYTSYLKNFDLCNNSVL
jgi:hypothetical protein